MERCRCCEAGIHEPAPRACGLPWLARPRSLAPGSFTPARALYMRAHARVHATEERLKAATDATEIAHLNKQAKDFSAFAVASLD